MFPKRIDFSVATAKTVGGVATVRGTFIAGGTYINGESNPSSDVIIRGSKLSYVADGYQFLEDPLEPFLRFKPKEPRMVVITVYLKPK